MPHRDPWIRQGGRRPAGRSIERVRPLGSRFASGLASYRDLALRDGLLALLDDASQCGRTRRSSAARSVDVTIGLGAVRVLVASAPDPAERCGRRLRS